jgi:hypothetical protein
MEKIVLISQIAATLFLTGVIWIIQLVQYPFFSHFEGGNFTKYHSDYTFWITPVVAPAMIVELACSFFILFYPPEIDSKLLYLGLFLTIIIWLSTFFIQVPLHEKLAAGFDADAYKSLVNTNWIRTIAWMLRAFLMIYFVWKFVRV